MRQVVTGLASLMSFFLLFSLVAGDGFAAQEKGNTIAIGKRSILSDKLPEAKKEAVSDALYASVERAMLGMLSQTDITRNLDLLYDQVLFDPERYVETYRVLAEVEKEGQYMVAVEAAINLPALEAFFTRTGIMGMEKETPSVLLLISEQSFNEVLPRYWWGKNPLPYTSLAEGAIVDFLEKKGYTLVGKGPDRPNPEALGITFDFVHDSIGAIKLAAALNADVVVMGRARAEEPSNRMGDERSYQANIGLEIFATQPGDSPAASPIVSINQSAVVKNSVEEEGANQALVQSGELAAQELVTNLDNYWSARQQTIRSIETRVEGADYLSSFIMLRKVLNDMPGIQDIQTKELGSDQAIVDIVFKGNAVTLADLLMLKTFDSFSIEISDVTRESMVIRFVTKKDVPPVQDSEIKKAYISE